MAGILGYTAFYLMVATVLWGVLLATRLLDRRVRRQTLYGGHMVLAILALVTSVLHACVHLFRHDAYFDLKKITIPWLGGADTIVSVGILGLEIVICVAISVWLQRRISYRRWHRFHWWAYGGFALIAVHTVLASREKHFSLIIATIAASIAIAAALATIRVVASVARPDDSDYWFDVVEDARDESYFR
ncbi:MAG: ferric reductase-like transmembrane domain-containing protein [Frankia sp.]